MFHYLPRVIDAELDERLASSGAVLIEGPKGCGKTETATQHATTTIRFDTNPSARAQVGLDPQALFEVKLTGDQGVIDNAARGLLDFASEIDSDRHGQAAALVVITATGGAGRRRDGVHVVPITALGP